MRVAVSGYEIDDDPGRVDAGAAWRFLSTEAYWGRWRPREVLDEQIATAWRLVGAYATGAPGGAGTTGGSGTTGGAGTTGGSGTTGGAGTTGGSGGMVGFARAFSDGASVAYLADVYVLAEHRGHGLATAMLRLMVDDGPGAEFRWMLHTSDAHPLYEKFGFAPPNASYLERPPAPSRAPLAP